MLCFVILITNTKSVYAAEDDGYDYRFFTNNLFPLATDSNGDGYYWTGTYSPILHTTVSNYSSDMFTDLPSYFTYKKDYNITLSFNTSKTFVFKKVGDNYYQLSTEFGTWYQQTVNLQGLNLGYYSFMLGDNWDARYSIEYSFVLNIIKSWRDQKGFEQVEPEYILDRSNTANVTSSFKIGFDRKDFYINYTYNDLYLKDENVNFYIDYKVLTGSGTFLYTRKYISLDEYCAQFGVTKLVSSVKLNIDNLESLSYRYSSIDNVIIKGIGIYVDDGMLVSGSCDYYSLQYEDSLIATEELKYQLDDPYAFKKYTIDATMQYISKLGQFNIETRELIDDPDVQDPDGGNSGDDDGFSLTDIIKNIKDGGGIVSSFFNAILETFGAFGQIPNILNSIFPFIPTEVLSVMFLGLFAVIVIGVIKAIRG
ncbi:MAG: hypothetical protein K0Q49_2123 [Haloplasmataceae bacterium]|jgi:hypothetical protein|nr:hypothetical protein [Haloplasmataceae bacterium]